MAHWVLNNTTSCLFIPKEALHAVKPATCPGRMCLVAAEGFTQLFQQLALALVEFDRSFHHHATNQIAHTATTHRSYALAAQAEQLAGLGAFGNLQLDPAVQGGYFQLAAQGGINNADGHFAVQVAAVPLEDIVLLDVDHHIEITGRTTFGTCFTFAAQADAVTCVHTWWNLDRQFFAVFDAALAMAAGTGIGNHLAAAMTARTGLLHGKETLLHANLAGTVTGATGCRAGAFFGAAAATDFTFAQGRDANLDLAAAHCLFQADFDVVTQIGTTLGTGTTTTAVATEDVAEDITKDVRETSAAKTCTTAHLRINPGMAVLIVGLALFGVGQHFVGFGGLFEFAVGVLVVRVAVRVVFHGQTAIGLFDFGLAGTTLYTQHLIKITFRHSYVFPGFTIGQKDQRGSKPPRDPVSLPHKITSCRRL